MTTETLNNNSLNNLLMESQIKMKFETVTPEIADKWLDKNPGNRRVSDAHVNNLSSQMMKGLWRDNGDTIKFNSKGQLKDGQHRLSAIIKSKKTISMWVAYNVDDKVFPTLDTGKSRSAGDVLSIQGYKHPTGLAAIAKGILNYENGNYSNLGHNSMSPKSGRRPGPNSTVATSNELILKFVKENEERLLDIEEQTRLTTRRFKFIGTAVIGTMMWVLGNKHRTMMEEFFEKYAQADHTPGTPLYVLREKLMREYAKAKGRGSYSAREQMTLIIYTWNAYRQGKRKIESLTIANNYTFPKPL